MKRNILVILSLVLASLLFPGASHSADQVRIESIVPADSLMLMMVDDAPGFIKTWPDTPMGKLWNDPQVKRFFAPLREEMELDRWEEMTREATGFPLSEILENLTGQMAVVVDEYDIAGEAEEISAAVIAAVGERDEMIASLMALDLQEARDEAEEGVDYREVEEEFQGEILRIREIVTAEGATQSDGWTIVDGMLLMAEPKSLLQELVANTKKRRAASPFDQSSHFRKFKSRAPESDVLFYVNLQSMVPRLIEQIQKEESEPNELGITPDAMIAALALDNLEAAFMTTRTAKSVTTVDAGLLYRENKGIVRALAYKPGPVKLPQFLPAGTVSASVTNFSVSEMWVAIKEMFAAMSPMMAAGMDTFLQQFSTGAGFDLERGLIGSFGDSFVSAQFFRESDQPGVEPTLDDLETLYAVAVTDRQSLEMALESLKTLAGQGMEFFDQREYLDETIFIAKQPLPEDVAGGPERRLAYVLTDDHLFVSIGSTAPLESVLGGTRNGEHSVWKRRDIKQALEALPSDASSLAYYDVGSLVSGFFKSLVSLQELGELSDDDEEADAICDPEAAPDPAAIRKYFGIGVASIEKNGEGLFSNLRLLAP